MDPRNADRAETDIDGNYGTDGRKGKPVSYTHLEINANHPIFGTLTKLYETDKEKLKSYAQLLYTQALLIEGLSVEDPVAFSNQICDLMIEQ